MKKFFLLMMFLVMHIGFAQQGINYKAIVKDGSGNVVTTPIVVQFIIYKGAALTNIVYHETNNTTPNANGLAILNIGTGTVVSGVFSGINWASDDHFLNVQIDTGTGFVNMGTTQFMAVPYAKHSKTSEAALNVSGLEKITENGNSGWRLIGRYPDFYGNIGANATDLSSSYVLSSVNGATGNYSTALGVLTKASGSQSTAMGNSTTAFGDVSTAMGVSTFANGYFSTSMGNNTKADAQSSTAIGRYNVGGGSATNWVGAEPLFEIGNGATNSNRSNAITVLKNGNTGIGNNTPTSLFEVGHQNGVLSATNITNAFSIRNLGSDDSWQFQVDNSGTLVLYRDGDYRGYFHNTSGAYVQASDIRLKRNITPLTANTLQKLMQLKPVSYLMNSQKDTKLNVGLISQEVQKIFPSVTYYNKELDILSLSYTELIPILIKSMQEQQTIIENQNKKYIELLKRIEKLENN